MKPIVVNKEEMHESMSSYIENEKNNLFTREPKPKKKFFSFERKKKIKKFFKRFSIATIIILYVTVLVVIGMSVDYHYNTIYDEYEELDKEARYLVETKMKELTISKNVYVHFLVVYKDIGDYFYEEKIDQERKYVAIVYNVIDNKFMLKSNIDYLVKDVTLEDVKDLKEEIPIFFDIVEDNIKENVYMMDYSTITRDIFGDTQKEWAIFLIVMITAVGIGVVFIIRN